jgi:hypothetical protein
VIDEMFRYEIARWAKTFSILAMNIVNALSTLVAVRASPTLRVSHRNQPISPEWKIDSRVNMAIAMGQVSRINR